MFKNARSFYGINGVPEYLTVPYHKPHRILILQADLSARQRNALETKKGSA